MAAAAESESPARDTSARGRGRGGRGIRGGRGRGTGRGGSTASSSLKLSAAKLTGRGGTRRGRAKTFTDSRVQAAYERQRDLKATYQAVAHAIKPALQELADRAIEDAIKNQESYKLVPEYRPLILELHRNFQNKMDEFDNRLSKDLALAKGRFNANKFVAEREFEVRLALHILLPCCRRSFMLTRVPHRMPLMILKSSSSRVKRTAPASSLPSLLEVYLST